MKNKILAILLVLLSVLAVTSSTLAREDKGRKTVSISLDTIIADPMVVSDLVNVVYPVNVCTISGRGLNILFMSPSCSLPRPDPCKAEAEAFIVGNAGGAGDVITAQAFCGTETAIATATVPLGGGSSFVMDGPTDKGGPNTFGYFSISMHPTTLWSGTIKFIDP